MKTYGGDSEARFVPAPGPVAALAGPGTRGLGLPSTRSLRYGFQCGPVTNRSCLRPSSGERHSVVAQFAGQSPGDHPVEIEQHFETTHPESLTLVAERPAGGLCGFLEAGAGPCTEGCPSSPVGYIEGWWVDAAFRRQGFGAGLVRAAENWARSLVLRETASDTSIGKRTCRRAHEALGYSEDQHVVCFRESL